MVPRLTASKSPPAPKERGKCGAPDMRLLRIFATSMGGRMQHGAIPQLSTPELCRCRHNFCTTDNKFLYRSHTGTQPFTTGGTEGHKYLCAPPIVGRVLCWGWGCEATSQLRGCRICSACRRARCGTIPFDEPLRTVRHGLRLKCAG